MMKEVELNVLETENLESYHLDLSYLKERCYNEDKLTELEKISHDEKIIGLYDAKKIQPKIVNTMVLSVKLEGSKETQIEIAKSLLQKKSS